MDPLYLRKLRIDRQIQQQMKNLKSEEKPNSAGAARTSGAAAEEAVKAPEQMKQQANELVKNIRDEVMTPRRQPKYNYIASMERSDYVKKMMNLPRTLPELLIQLQRPNYNRGVHNVLNQQIPQPDVMQDEVLGNRPMPLPDNRPVEPQRPQQPQLPQSPQLPQQPQQPILQPDGKPMPLPDNRPIVPQQPSQPQVPQQPLPPVQPEPLPPNIQQPHQPVVPSTPLQPAIPNQPQVPPQVPNQPVQPQLPPQVPNHPQQPVPPVQPQPLPNIPQQPLPPNIQQPQQPVVPQPPHNPVRPPVHEPMPLPDNRPIMPPPPQPDGRPVMPPPPNNMRPPVQPEPLPNIPQRPNVPQVPLQPAPPHVPNHPQQPLPPAHPQPLPNIPPQPMPPHNPVRPPVHEPMPLPDHRPVGPLPPNHHHPHPLPPNKDVIPPRTEYLDGNVEMYVPRHPHHNHRPISPEPNIPLRPELRPEIRPELRPEIRPELRPEPPRHKPPVEPPVSEQVGAVKDSTIDEAQAALYAQLSMNDIANPTLTQMRQRLSGDAFELLFTGMLNLNDLSETIKHSGKDARAKLILAMANASKQGFDNSQISGSLKMVSESMALEENNPASILKNIILLYLPWYPLQEGVGFKLAIETMPNMSDFSSLLKVFIQTRNYGNVNGSLILMNANNVDMQIQCDDNFPKDDLLERMKDVTDNHTMQSNITVEQRAQMTHDVDNQQAKVNLSSTYDLNPFLLLMAHSFIKNTIIIDGAANA